MAWTVTPWAEVTAKVRANVNADGTSKAAGYMGSDSGTFIRLGANRFVMPHGDTMWATAAGQRAFGDSRGVGPGGTAAFVGGAFSIIDGPNPETATWTHYIGANEAGAPAPIFKPTVVGPDGKPNSSQPGEPCFGFPTIGTALDTVLIMSTGLSFRVSAFPGFRIHIPVFVLIENPQDAPNTWRYETIAFDPSTIAVRMFPAALVDDGGYLLVFWGGPGSDFSVSRYPRDRVKLGILDRPEWWDDATGTWKPDRQAVPGYPEYGRTRSRGGFVSYSPGFLEGSGGASFHKLPDGRWMNAGMNKVPIPGITDRFGGFSRANLFPGKFGPMELAYDVPEDSATLYSYGFGVHPDLTWASKPAGGLVVHYNVNGDAQFYFPHFLKAVES